MLVRIPLFLYVAQAVERVLAVAFGDTMFESHYRHIFYVAQAVERVLAKAFGNYVGSSPTIGIFLYVAQAVERVSTVSFGTHNTHKRQTSMPPVGFEPTISAGEGP